MLRVSGRGHCQGNGSDRNPGDTCDEQVVHIPSKCTKPRRPYASGIEEANTGWQTSFRRTELHSLLAHDSVACTIRMSTLRSNRILWQSHGVADRNSLRNSRAGRRSEAKARRLRSDPYFSSNLQIGHSAPSPVMGNHRSVALRSAFWQERYWSWVEHSGGARYSGWTQLLRLDLIRRESGTSLHVDCPLNSFAVPGLPGTHLSRKALKSVLRRYELRQLRCFCLTTPGTFAILSKRLAVGTFSKSPARDSGEPYARSEFSRTFARLGV